MPRWRAAKYASSSAASRVSSTRSTSTTVASLASSKRAAGIGGVRTLLLGSTMQAVALMLYAWREGDANMRSVWLCSRNDAIGNVAVMLAALGVFGTGSAWPDLAVAAVMAALALLAGISVLRQARREMARA